MENTLRAPIAKSYSGQHLLILSIVALLGLWYYQMYGQVQHTKRDQLQMEKSSWKNGKHANSKSKSEAEQQYQKVQEELKSLESMPGKTAEQAKRVKELKGLKKHWRGKKDWGGEHHSQKHKGN